MRISRALSKQIVATYAEVLYRAAVDADVVDAVGDQLSLVGHVVRGHAELRGTLRDESLPAENRVAVVRSVFGDFEPVLVSMLSVIVDRGESALLPAVIETFGEVAEADRGMAVATVTTAVQLDDRLRASIKSKLSAELGKGVVLREKVDPAVIGGIIIDAAGRRLDASIQSRLEHARAALSSTHTGGDA
jgi:F-type H+-transporting ATPase subunit delta